MTALETLAVYTAIVVVVACLLGALLAKLGDDFPFDDLD